MRQTHSLTEPSVRAVDAQLASDIQYSLSLSPRQLPSRYLYDDLGSALFEAICLLPWYRVTRTEQAMLRTHAAAIVRAAGSPSRVIELGAGNGDKLATLIEHGWPLSARLAVELIDVSAGALQTSRQRLAAFEHVNLVTRPLAYDQGLLEIARSATPRHRTMVLFLGSNIGNFDPPDAEMFLRQVRAVLAPGDTVLIGADLVKPERELLLAYDDPLGITAAFNLNLLVRLNRELRADFDIARFAHRAVWRADASRIEMHLESLSPQHVRIPDADIELDLEAGETIWTERSYKYRAEDLSYWLDATGLVTLEQWRDEADGFALTLARVDD